MEGGRIQPTVLLLGGGRYNVLSILNVRSSGFRTMVADRHPDAPGLAVADVALVVDPSDSSALLSAVKAHGGVDGVVPLSEFGVRPAASLCAQLGLPSISEESAALATSKAGMRGRWRDLSTYSPPSITVWSKAGALEAVDELGLPSAFKPDRSNGGSRGVRLVDNRADVADAFSFAHAAGLPRSGVVVEPVMEGSEHSCEVLIWQDDVRVLCISDRYKHGAPYRVDVSIQYPAQLAAGVGEAVEDMCRQAVRALGMTQGPAHVEFILTKDGPMLIELGARCGGGHTPLIAHHVSGVNALAETCRMACGLGPTNVPPGVRAGADYRFLVFPPGRVANVDIAPEVLAHPGLLDVVVALSQGADVTPVRTGGDRSGFVVALAERRSEAVTLADWACSEISVTYADGTVVHPGRGEALSETTDHGRT